jgi:hypothetical protein
LSPEIVLIESDAELVMRLQRGDRDAFTILVLQWEVPLLRIAYRITGQLAEAEDVRQRVFLKLLDIRARGFLVKNLGMEMTIWVDPATRLPVRMESADRFQGKEVRATVFDFQIDPAIDDALFRVDPPPGYALRKAASDALGMGEKTFLNPEKAAEILLRSFAEKTGGAFPKRLDDFAEFDERFPKKKGEIANPGTLKIAHSVTRFMMATQPLKGGFGYRSEGVKLGDAEKILFWYRPEGAAKYRVLYGDLHVADVTEEKLPEKPKR